MQERRREQKRKQERRGGGTLDAYREIRKPVPKPTRREAGGVNPRRERRETKQSLRDWED